MGHEQVHTAALTNSIMADIPVLNRIASVSSVTCIVTRSYTVIHADSTAAKHQAACSYAHHATTAARTDPTGLDRLSQPAGSPHYCVRGLTRLMVECSWRS